MTARYETLAAAILDRNPDSAHGNLDRAAVTIYRNNVRAAYHRVLGDTYPIVKRLVGETFFRAAALEYFHAHPPMSRLVSRYGDAFPAFIEQFSPAATLPYLGDVARIERAWLDAYHAENARTFSATDLLARLEACPDEMLTPIASMRLLAVRHGAYQIWSHNKAERAGHLTVADTVDHVVIWRPNNEVLTRAVTAPVYELLSCIRRGGSFAESLHAVSAGDTDPTDLILNFASFEIVSDFLPLNKENG